MPAALRTHKHLLSSTVHPGSVGWLLPVHTARPSPGVVGVGQAVRQVSKGGHLIDVAHHHGVQARVGHTMPVCRGGGGEMGQRYERHR